MNDQIKKGKRRDKLKSRKIELIKKAHLRLTKQKERTQPIKQIKRQQKNLPLKNLLLKSMK